MEDEVKQVDLAVIVDSLRIVHRQLVEPLLSTWADIRDLVRWRRAWLSIIVLVFLLLVVAHAGSGGGVAVVSFLLPLSYMNHVEQTLLHIPEHYFHNSDPPPACWFLFLCRVHAAGWNAGVGRVVRRWVCLPPNGPGHALQTTLARGRGRVRRNPACRRQCDGSTELDLVLLEVRVRLLRRRAASYLIPDQPEVFYILIVSTQEQEI